VINVPIGKVIVATKTETEWRILKMTSLLGGKLIIDMLHPNITKVMVALCITRAIIDDVFHLMVCQVYGILTKSLRMQQI
jgi:hypothetical protein